MMKTSITTLFVFELSILNFRILLAMKLAIGKFFKKLLLKKAIKVWETKNLFLLSGFNANNTIYPGQVRCFHNVKNTLKHFPSTLRPSKNGGEPCSMPGFVESVSPHSPTQPI